MIKVQISNGFFFITDIKWFLFYKWEKSWILLNLRHEQNLLSLIQTKPFKRKTFNTIIAPFFTNDRIELTKAGFLIIKEYPENDQVTRFIPIKQDCLLSQIVIFHCENFKKLSFFWVGGFNPFFKNLDRLKHDYSSLINKLESSDIMINTKWNEISGIEFDLSQKNDVQNAIKSLGILKKEGRLSQLVFAKIISFIPLSSIEECKDEAIQKNSLTKS